MAKLLRLVTVGAVLLPFLAAVASAQSTGTITGRVFDQATGRSLQGAVVKIAGSPAYAYTDVAGRYTLAGVAAGAQTVEVEYVGLDTLRQAATVTAGATATVNAAMKSDVLQLSAFEVREAARGQALAINQQKTASGIVNIISEETFGAMGEGNIGYALQRLPGLSVDDDEDGAPSGANIRGLPDDFNSFQLDGNRVGTRGFNTRNLSADGISTIEVIKAPTPDRDGDAIGGIINVVSRSAFQRDGREFRLSASGSYLDLRDTWGHNLKGTYSDIFSLFGKEKNLGISVTVSQSLSQRSYDIMDTDWAVLNRATNPTYRLWDDVVFYTPNLTMQVNDRETKTRGFNLAIDYRTDAHNSFYVKPLYSHYDTRQRRIRGRHHPDTRHQDALTGRKTLDPTLNFNGMKSGPLSLGEYRYYGEQADTENDLRAVSFGGKHEFGSSKLTHDFFYSYTHAARDNHSEYIIRNIGPAGTGFQMETDHRNRLFPIVTILSGDPRDLSRISVGNLQMAPTKTKTWAYSGKVDWEKAFVGDRVASKLKVGAKYRSTEPQNDRTQFSYSTGALGTAFYGQFMTPINDVVLKRQLYMDVNMDKVYELLRTQPQNFVLTQPASATNSVNADYKAKESTSAAYGQYSAQMGPHTILGGLRVEKNSWEAQRKRLNQTTLVVEPIKNGNDYTVWLPGLHFRHEVRKNLILRESLNRSYARPNLGNLTAGRTTSALGNITDGNPNLGPTKSDNADVQLEYYTPNGGLYSVGVFYKKMDGFYYNVIKRFDVLDANGEPVPLAPGVSGAFQWSRPEMGKGATNYGTELIARQKLRFLPKPFNGLGVSLSATFTESEVKEFPGREGEKLPTPGFSKSMFYGALEYAHSRFQGQVSYRYRTGYISSLAADRFFDDWFASREQVDVETSFRLTKKLKLFANVDNITDRPQVSYQGINPGLYNEDLSHNGWRATVGLEFTF